MNEKQMISKVMAAMGGRNLGRAKSLTEEQRAARSERMKAQIAAGKMKRGKSKNKVA